MKTKVKSFLKELSYVPEVTIDLELTGRHHKELMTGNKDLYERVVLSVLDDLIEEDVYSLTFPEVFYYFQLIKVQSLGDKATIPWTCKKEVTRGSMKVACDTKNTYQFKFSSRKIIPLESGLLESQPVTKLVVGGTEKTFTVKLPKMRAEIEILENFQERGFSKELIYRERDVAYEYALERLVAGLVFKDEGLVSSAQERLLVVEALQQNLTYRQLNDLLVYLKKLQSLGVDMSPVEGVCSNCGGMSSFRLPLSAGLMV